MTRASCFREFVKYSSLNVLGMLGLSCYIVADTFFVSKGLGTNGLAALNLAIPIYSFVHGSGLMIGMGGGTKYSIQKNQGIQMKTNKIFTNCIYFAIIFAVLFVVTGICFSDLIITLLGADESVYAMTKTYMRVILLFAPGFLLNNVLLCFVRNDGAPQLAMMAMLGGSLSNIILDYVFIFPCKMGIFGAVFATGLAPAISLAILSMHFIRKKNGFRLTKCKWSSDLFAWIVSCGIPALITEVSSGIVMIVFNTIILKLQGNTGVAAYGVIANLSLVVIATYTGIAQGIQPLISRDFGRNKMRNVICFLKYALLTMFLLSCVIYLGIFVFASSIAAAFNSEQNELLQAIATTGLKLYFIACPFVGFNVNISVYFTSTEQARAAHIISFLRGFLLIIPTAFLLAAIAGINGVWSAFPVTEGLVAIVGCLFLFIQPTYAK